MVSASELVRGVILATIGCVLFMALFTVGPYLFIPKQAAKKDAAKAAPTNAAAPVESTAASIPTPAVDVTKVPSTDADAGAAAKALNIDEVKTADPNVNPLDKDLDKLLDGTE